MRSLVIGLGSMGKRRIRNLLQLGEKDVLGFDLREDRRREAEEKYGVQTFDTLGEAIRADPDVWIISVPPAFHLEYALKALEEDVHFFCETPVADSVMAIDRLIEVSCKSRRLAAPSCNMCFHSGVEHISKMMNAGEIGQPLCMLYEVGHFLPDWHPYEDYRSYYVSGKTFGGGADVIPMELVWILRLFGDVKGICCRMQRLGQFEIEAPDSYQLTLEFESGAILELHNDVICRDSCRRCRLIGREGTIIWDAVENWVKLYKASDRRWTEYHERDGYSMEEMYVEEMAHFIKAIRGEQKYLHSLEEERKVLRVWETAEKSAMERRWVEI